MKKLVLLALLFIMALMSGCSTDTEDIIELKNPEIHVYKMSDSRKLYVYKYETPDAYIYRYTIAGETRNVNIVPKSKVNADKENESIFTQDSYFDF